LQIFYASGGGDGGSQDYGAGSVCSAGDGGISGVGLRDEKTFGDSTRDSDYAGWGGFDCRRWRRGLKDSGGWTDAVGDCSNDR
jgi:hypothetical protein